MVKFEIKPAQLSSPYSIFETQINQIKLGIAIAIAWRLHIKCEFPNMA
jgi:hypothetical protein